ncbi:hypothetical protein I8748_12890 [Nostoc sp. CENA67]|uniref:Uncharacterized protein n=1 Tax=Amazonocrinis nigriterrae CENA67 TaxID=2794033 RepID=A0A8J7HNS2_9NOST|nr:hypothetical protein [Amazonocrinis nigriterrae]MBH8563066.1 hypothetical protein [Amazonocrinis nigriterrae CENA67]
MPHTTKTRGEKLTFYSLFAFSIFLFGVLKATSARGDFQVLAEQNRRTLRLHFGQNLPVGLELLQTTVKQILN